MLDVSGTIRFDVTGQTLEVIENQAALTVERFLVFKRAPRGGSYVYELSLEITPLVEDYSKAEPTMWHATVTANIKER